MDKWDARSEGIRHLPGLNQHGRPGALNRYLSTARHVEPTIYALSTAPGRAAIAIIRISGEVCLSIYQALCPRKEAPKPRYATLRSLYEPDRPPTPDNVLDSNALILYFPAPRTVTGEDVLELHVHGGPAVVKAVLAAISRCSGSGTVRYAEPGEFTRRAFMNDRLDLTRVEALGDTLSATTEQQRRLSVRGTTNNLAKRYEQWRQQLLYARGELEALIDFSEDQHFDESPNELCASVAAQVEVLRRLIQAHSRNAVRGEMLRNGIAIALLGAPNAGKSSLLNCIVGRQAAIVSQEAGTTRDVVEVGIDLGGYFCRLGDTAGLRKARHEATQSAQMQEVIGQIEQEGMRRAKERAAESDVVIVVLSFEYVDGTYQLSLDQEVISSAAQLVQEKDNVIVVINKQDTAPQPSAREAAVQTVMQALPGISADRIHLISCKEAAEGTPAPSPTASHAGNMQTFLNGLTSHFHDMTAAITPDGTNDADPSIWQDSLGASERHRLLLDQCSGWLDAFIAEVQQPEDASAGNGQNSGEADIVVAAEHLRAAADCLAKITGKGEAGDVEEVLGVVFEKFCVGK
ncbi:mitochondrial splicing system protein [Saxophila tyrrhenica]|uniref:Mitochondrial splicing system protein n=1 Tax=Saxophila tyrrhenica TaxID=1690608 RepID=A0AAV9PFJ7_9PEZI|nr:mitochondrial splicing system protein [Saxophila tyrrhenica]